LLETAAFEAFSGAAWAEVISAEFFEELFLAVNDARASLDLGFRGIAFSAFAHRLDENGSSSWLVFRMAHLLFKECLEST
jgi:hypothetical protein